MSYTRYDAMADEAEEKYERLVSDVMDDLLAPIFDEVYSLDPEEGNDPHPWSRTRHLFEIWTEDGDDGLRTETQWPPRPQCLRSTRGPSGELSAAPVRCSPHELQPTSCAVGQPPLRRYS